MSPQLPSSKIRMRADGPERRDVEPESGLRVYIPKRVYEKMLALTMVAESETSAMGMVHLESNGQKSIVGQEIWVDDIFYIENQSSTASTALDPEDLSKMMIGLVQDGIDTMFVKLWFHTHYNFQVFWSGTDKNTAENVLENSRWTLSIVMNQKHDLLARVDIYRPTLRTYNRIPVYLVVDSPMKNWKKNCLLAKEKINNRIASENVIQDLSPEFVQKMREQGIPVDLSDIKQREAPVVIETKNLGTAKFRHVCTCGNHIEVPEDTSRFKCQTCNSLWDVTVKSDEAPSPAELAPNEEPKSQADRLYDEAVKLLGALRQVSDPKEIEGMCIGELESYSKDFNPSTQMKLIHFCPKLSNLSESEDCVHVGSHQALEIFYNKKTDEFIASDEESLIYAEKEMKDEYWANPARYMPLVDSNGLVYATEDHRSFWYDLVDGKVLFTLKTVEEHFAEDEQIEYFEQVSNRRIKNLISKSLSVVSFLENKPKRGIEYVEALRNKSGLKIPKIENRKNVSNYRPTFEEIYLGQDERYIGFSPSKNYKDFIESTMPLMRNKSDSIENVRLSLDPANPKQPD